MRLCVLSACQTGRGRTTNGEGVQGLVRAFHLAGCADVVATLWSISDAATEPLMEEFYRQLWQEEKTPIEALRQAQLVLYRHPERVFASTRPRSGLSRLPDAAAARPAALPHTSPLKWWAAFVLSSAGLSQESRGIASNSNSSRPSSNSGRMAKSLEATDGRAGRSSATQQSRSSATEHGKCRVTNWSFSKPPERNGCCSGTGHGRITIFCFEVLQEGFPSGISILFRSPDNTRIQHFGFGWRNS